MRAIGPDQVLSCYRSRVLSLEQQDQCSGHAPRIFVHDLGTVARDEVILPEATLAAVERNVLTFAEQRQALRGLGMSTQQGPLFHGTPGTGKTHCIRYPAGRLPLDSRSSSASNTRVHSAVPCSPGAVMISTLVSPLFPNS